MTKITRRTAISHITCLGGEPLNRAKLLTQDFVRPTFQAGHLTLLVQPFDDECLVPFEQPHPTPCCANH